MKAWVLWSDVFNEGGTEISRVYISEERAQADYALVSDAQSWRQWHLDEVDVYGEAPK